MRIGQAHRNKIWKSLLEWRASNHTLDVSQLQPSLSSASDLGLNPQGSGSQQSSYCPGYFEITRYTFKQVFSLEADGHRDDGHRDDDDDDDNGTGSSYKLRKRSSGLDE